MSSYCSPASEASDRSPLDANYNVVTSGGSSIGSPVAGPVVSPQTPFSIAGSQVVDDHEIKTTDKFDPTPEVTPSSDSSHRPTPAQQPFTLKPHLQLAREINRRVKKMLDPVPALSSLKQTLKGLNPSHSTLSCVDGSNKVLLTPDQEFEQVLFDLMFTEETPSKMNITAYDFKNILQQQKLNVNFTMAVVCGLPSCGKSLLVQKILEVNISTTNPLIFFPNDKGLAVHRFTVLGAKPYKQLVWTRATNQSGYIFCITSAILRDALLQGQEVEFTDDLTKLQDHNLFSDQNLMNHFQQTYKSIDTAIQKVELNKELKKILPSGVTLVNIWDVGVNKAVVSLLTVLAPYGFHILPLVCFSLERDVDNLHALPDLSASKYSLRSDDKVMMKHCSRLDYLFQLALTQKASSTQKPLVFVGFHGNITLDELETAKEKMKSELEAAAAKYGVSKESIHLLSLNPENTEDLQQLKKILEQLVMGDKSNMLELPLSWVFLRSYCHSINQLSISFIDLQKLALELMSEESFDSFLKIFTSFGSLIYVPNIPSLSKEVILQPAAFVDYVSKLVYPDEDPVSYNIRCGVLPLDFARSRVVKHSDLIVSVMKEVGMAVLLSTDKIDFSCQLSRSQSQPSGLDSPMSFFKDVQSSVVDKPVSKTRHSSFASCLFVPSARTEWYQSNTGKDDSLFIIYGNVVPPDIQAFFVDEVLKTDNTYLVPTPECNAAMLHVRHEQVSHEVVYIFHGLRTEVRVECDNEDYVEQLCHKVFQCCENAITSLRKFFLQMGEVKYSISCLKTTQQQTYEYLRRGRQLCDQCSNPVGLRKLWKKVVEQQVSSAP